MEFWFSTSVTSPFLPLYFNYSPSPIFTIITTDFLPLYYLNYNAIVLHPLFAHLSLNTFFLCPSLILSFRL